MFSANENIALRQHKKQVVEYVESCIPEEALDMGTTVMAMQVSCKAPGCVPLETAIVIVFPKMGEELIPGLPESCGGNYKTKVLKPMNQVTKEDILEALPPEFPGGKRSMEKLCLQARDVMLGQITQLFSEEDEKGRQLMAEYLQQCLKEYIDRGCNPPEWGEPFQGNSIEQNQDTSTDDTQQSSSSSSNTAATGVTKKGNFVFKRPAEEEWSVVNVTPSVSISHTQSHDNMPRTDAKPQVLSPPKSSESIIQQLGEQRHAPGIRQPGCPCCDPDNTDNLIDKMMAL